MNRTVRLVVAVMLSVQAAGLVFVSLLLGRVLTGYGMSMNGTDPHQARAGLLVLAGGYVALVVATGLLLLGFWSRPGRWLARARRIALAADVAVQFLLVVASLRLAGWPAFAWMLALLTLLTLTMVSTWEGGTDRLASGGVVRRPQVGDPYAQLGEHASQ